MNRLLTALTLACFATGLAAATPPPDRPPGQLDALGKDGKPLGGCPLRHTDVQVSVSGFVARVVVTQEFENPFPDPVEAIYTFPLSDRGAVDHMEMRTGGRVIRGDIKERGEARRIYEQARANGQLAGLLDQERPNIFTQSLANLMPGAAVQIRIEYTESLKYADGAFEFAFPTVVGPRFVPGAPTGHDGTGFAPDTDRVPDASRITPPVTPEGTRAGHDLGIAVQIDAGVPILDVTAPLHAVDVTRPDATHATVTLQSKHEIPNRDFVVRYAVAADALQSGYLTHRDAGGDGYVTFLLIPPKRVTAATAAPRELLFVIDRSGSQSGAPLDKAKETMAWILDHMNPNDTFQVIDFGSDARQLFERPQPASAAMRAKARTYIQALEANGGTLMAEAVRKACAQPADAHRLRIVTFMTDGYVGNDFEVLALVQQLRGTSRWFPFGTGNGVNRFLLENMARLGGGEPDYVLLSDPGDTVAARFHERIAHPALTDVSLEFRNLDVVDVLPAAVGDVWEQKPLVISARYRTAGHGQVVLRGFRGGEPYTETLDVNLPEREAEHGAIASMWARAKVDALMDQDLQAVQSGNFPKPLKDEVIRVALAHHLMTQFTSFVAVEDKVVNEGGRQRTVAVPVEMPDGVTYAGVFGDAAAAPGQAPMAAMGQPRSLSARGGLAMKSMNSAGGPAVTAAPPPPAEIARRKAEPSADREELDEGRSRHDAIDAASRTKLAPELLSLLEGHTSVVAGDGGWLQVEITLRDAAADTLRAVEAAGLQTTTAGKGTVRGLVRLDRLAALAALAEVVRIDPAR